MLYSLQRYLGSPSISVENREFYSYIILSLNFEVLCKRDIRSRDRDVRDRDYNPAIDSL